MYHAHNKLFFYLKSLRSCDPSPKVITHKKNIYNKAHFKILQYLVERNYTALVYNIIIYEHFVD